MLLCFGVVVHCCVWCVVCVARLGTLLRTFARHLLWFPWQPSLSLQASSLVGVGFPSPARLAVSFLAIIVRAADRQQGQ